MYVYIGMYIYVCTYVNLIFMFLVADYVLTGNDNL